MDLTRRLPGPDVVRGVALIGVVVMNYVGYSLIHAGRVEWGDAWIHELFDPWRGPLATRFAATFVLVAGVGVTLLTSRARSSGDAVLVLQVRLRLIRRGALLYVVGLLLDEWWPGTILPYYGVMFVLAGGLFTLRTRSLVVIGAAAALAGWAIEIWVAHRLERGVTTRWLTAPDAGTPQWFVLGAFVNGTHPLLPWMAFLCAGIVLGRSVRNVGWRARVALAGSTAFVAATLTSVVLSRSDAVERTLSGRAFSTDPGDRTILYTVSALGTALVAYAALDLLAERLPRQTAPLRRAGQLSLTLYLLHIALYEGLRRTDVYVPSTFAATLAFAAAFWTLGIAAAAWWNRRFGMGPAERVYRRVGG